MGKLLTYLLLFANAFLVGMLALSSYSPFLHPRCYPVVSCLGLVFPLFLAAVLGFFLLWLVVRRRYALLSLAGLLVCFPQIRTYIPVNPVSGEIPEGSVKLLSYNVMGFNAHEKKDGRNPVLSYLADSGADIICLQEYSVSGSAKQLTEKDVLTALKDYPYRSIHRAGSGGTSSLACFSKFPILSERPVGYESVSNGSMVYTLKMGADTLTLINNHLESNKLTKEDRGLYEDMIDDPDARKVKTRLRQFVRKFAEATSIRSVQADSVAGVIAGSRYSSIIACGDFNDVSISYVHRALTRRLNDAFTESGNGLGISYNQNKFYFRIDNILVSPDLKPYRCTVDDSIKDSDHYPIWCYLHK